MMGFSSLLLIVATELEFLTELRQLLFLLSQAICSALLLPAEVINVIMYKYSALPDCQSVTVFLKGKPLLATPDGFLEKFLNQSFTKFLTFIDLCIWPCMKTD